MLTHSYNGNSKTVSAIYFLRIPITKIVLASQTLWDIITSCFGSGIWYEDRAWIDTDLWKN